MSDLRERAWLPGVFRCLVERSVLSADTPGLQRLSERYWADPETMKMHPVGERLTQPAWPLELDIAIALRAVECLELPDADDAYLAAARRVAAGEDTDSLVEPARLATALLTVGEGPIETYRRLSETHPESFAPVPDDVLAAERERLSPWDPVVREVVLLLIDAARQAADGWQMYYAYRGLPASSSTQAARVVTTVVDTLGDKFLPELVAHAHQLLDEREANWVTNSGQEH